MGEKIEFEARVIEPLRYVMPELSSWPFIQVAVPGVEAGKRYRVTLEPIEPELKPCPFCGGEAEIHIWPGRKNACNTAAYCQDCDSRGPFAENDVDAIQTWNRREPTC